MKLRTKLILLQLFLVLTMVTVVAALVGGILKDSMPLMEKDIETRAYACLQSIQADADIAIAANDRAELARALARCDFGMQIDPDRSFVAVTDQQGQVLVSKGRVPQLADAPRRGALRVERSGEGFKGVLPVSIEGRYLGAIHVAYSLERIASLRRAYLLFASVAFGLILVSGLASMLFALHLIRPLREMMDHVHQVARGNLTAQLAAGGTDELKQLGQDLNAMSTSLAESRAAVVGASRQAGMAEVATSILHNVGNVLNSVNVSASVIAENAQASEIANLDRVTRMVEDQGPELTQFLSQDERGKMVAKYLRTLTDHMACQDQKLTAEIGLLKHNINHIITIVAMQQTFARAGGVSEDVDPQDLVETALQLCGTQVRDIELVRDFAQGQQIETDRNKVLQILVNLITNAHHALRESDRADKRMTLSIGKSDDGHFELAVADNGIGIPAENLERVFQHGFSTRPDGHGFGLHSSANAATELNGTLACTSDGPGKGACFTLRLPTVFHPAARSAEHVAALRKAS